MTLRSTRILCRPTGSRGAGILFAAIALLGFLLAPPAGFAAQARNIILMIGDGMGPTQVWAARLYAQRELGRDLRMTELMNRGRTAYLANDTADAIVTESAAAATQIACGVRVPARAVGMGPDGKTPCKTILELARERGKGTGLVTTARITDATPAAFSAHVEDRGDENSVAAQQLRLGVDVLFGGGRRHFLPEPAGGARKDGRDLLGEARRAGYALPGTPEELRKLRSGKILGLFSPGNMALEIDRGRMGEPSLAQMTAKALEVLGRSRRGMFVMIEGGRIDHAAHANDAAGTVREVLAFDEAVGVALDFQRKRPGTLLIVTADHETGGMAITGTGGGATMNFAAIRNARGSLETLLAELAEKPTPAAIREAVNTQLAIAISDEEAALLAAAAYRKDPTQTYIPTPRPMVSILQRHLGVAWATQAHSASPVFVFGSGPGSAEITGFLHNTELFRIMRNALGPAVRDSNHESGGSSNAAGLQSGKK